MTIVSQADGFDRKWSFWSDHDLVAARTLEPGRVARLLARVRAGSLDDALIAGADPADSRQLAARAFELTSRRFRTSLADGLERLLQAAQGPPSPRRVLPRRSTALANACELRELAALLRGASPLYARGVAVLDRLLIDGSGPAYVGDAEALARRLRESRAAMVGEA
jgi:hypothetical protein